MGMTRDDVIKGLECCTFILGKRKCDECPYAKGPDCYRLIPDAKALLKAQEPVKPLKMEAEHVRKEPVVFSYKCPVCMCGLRRNWVACPICGTGVKWE